MILSSLQRHGGCHARPQAIAMHGGHADVAMRLGWKMMSRSRKPPGYWGLAAQRAPRGHCLLRGAGASRPQLRALGMRVWPTPPTVESGVGACARAGAPRQTVGSTPVIIPSCHDGTFWHAEEHAACALSVASTCMHPPAFPCLYSSEA